MRQAHIFASPSRIEGMPVAVAQAMASGLPVVATNVPGSNEEVVDGESGLLVPSENAAAFAEALRRLCEDAEMRLRFGRQGRQVAVSKFSWDEIGAQYEKIFLDAARRKKETLA